MKREDPQHWPAPKKLFRRWRRRKNKLLANLPALLERCRATGRAELVHELRVALRRLRFYLRLGRPLLGSEDVTRFLRWARRISRASGPVRDLDVALEWLQGRFHAEEVSERILEKRARAWQRFAGVLKMPGKTLLDRLQKNKKSAKVRDKLAKRYKKTELRIRSDVCGDATAFFKFNEEQQHRVRRLLRRWRYQREIGLRRRNAGKDKLLSILIELQEATGARQNQMLVEDALKCFRSLPYTNDLCRALSAEQALATDRIRAAFRALSPFCRKCA
ncbi:MAG: CHAD domain-containing protein [Verrucomicrobiia bacterium]